MNQLTCKLVQLSLLTTAVLAGLKTHGQNTGTPSGTRLQSVLPATSTLAATPRASFTPTSRQGYWNIDVVGDFTLPATKSLTFCGAGRNLHVKQDWSKLFRRGFSSIDQTRMVEEELNSPYMPKSSGWKSRLKVSQRALWIPGQYFGDAPFALPWARSSEHATRTFYQRPPGDPNYQNSIYAATDALRYGCTTYNDCPSAAPLGTYGLVFLDVENEWADAANQQDHVNLYVYLMKTLREKVSPQTLIGSINPVPLNGYGYSRSSDYKAAPHWLWSTPSRHTKDSRQRGMPDDIQGKTFGSMCDFQMPGVYFVYPDFDYTISHSGESDRHWLAGMLHEQEVNLRFAPQKRIAWQWLFNTQSGQFANSSKAEHAAPPAVAEGMAIFYWFTGAYGAILWDDWRDLNPGQAMPTPDLKGLGNERVYACYEHYLHGLWRLFKHHSDLFNGQEQYLNDQTECSFDGGKTWVKYNANQLKTRNLPFARAIVNGNQILIAATKPYAKPDEITRLKVRYLENGNQFYTDIALLGDEIFLGRAAITQPTATNQGDDFKSKAVKRVIRSRLGSKI